MRTLLRLCTIVALACAPAFAPSAAHAAGGPQVLVITTGNEAQDVADYAVERLHMEARRWNFTLVEGEPEDLTDLDGFDVVMLLNTGADPLDDAQQAALHSFVSGGGGFVATHSAAASEPEWDWYQELLGATALSPPAEPAAEQEVSFNAGSPITEGLDEDLEVTERWYSFDPAPAEPDSTVLAELGSGQPVAWTSETHRAFYASPGGSGDTWGERDFLQLIRQGIWWAAGEEGALVQNTEDAAPAWPYTLTFVTFVVAVAGGGSIAVWRLDRAETAGEAEPVKAAA
ncbi:ThuA domain-containing protein [Glycomyces sp. TRM65418]|uniref:ThuA domain-containing protein n=1 Tax=Glycomyces sp. TRM65418 TaxID=2867006 RepID=UPI001CE639CE|nr:ThuA domain-containing protein [Glycomyces sp. TRM65418]MCC3762328.1 ThuA domain-containing protein [Glycomyces sp. TRM65418]QZD56382.1 ThuA domain-containing protein [Glycomyces sp. TRM65418]